MVVKVAVIYYSATGTVHALARALADGVDAVGAEVRLRRVAELASEDAIDRNPLWRRHVDAVAGSVPEASLEDLLWADAYAFGTPTRFGTPSAQLKQFIDQTGGLWREGTLADKPVTAFTSAFNRHGGNEATILALGNVFYHWGSLIVPPGFTDPAVSAAGGNPYGASSFGSPSEGGPPGEALDAARYQGRRLAEIATRLHGASRTTDLARTTGTVGEPGPERRHEPRDRSRRQGRRP
jgi:NAD(P)H dehydrogenase (quinone)